MENTRNQDGIGEKELLVASFGTSYQDTRCRTIGAIEEELERSLSWIFCQERVHQPDDY